MQFKDGVIVECLKYEAGKVATIRLSGFVTQAMKICDEISKRLTGHEIVVTSAIDGRHMAKSLHYVGQAFDIRTRIYSTSQKELLVDEFVSALGDEYDVVDEGDHIHIEVDR